MDNSEKIKALEDQIEALKKQQSIFDKQPAIHKIAETLHGLRCRLPHEDMCSWYYENWETPGNARLEYLNKAKLLINSLNDDKELALKIAKLG